MASPLNRKLFSLSEVSKAQLSKILGSITGPKCIILDPNIIKPLERVCGVRWLRNNNIERIFKLEAVAPEYENAILYLAYTNFAIFKKIVDQIRSNPLKNKYHIIIVPKVLYIHENLLEKFGLLGDVVTLYSLQWQPIYLDEKVISLEVPDVYKTLYIEQDLSLLPIFAKSLWHLGLATGKTRFCFGLGQHSVATIKQLNLLYQHLPHSNTDTNDFGAVVLLDRNLDYPSALLTPTTYAALLNDVYRVNCGFCEYKEEDVDTKYDNKFNPIIKKEPVNFILDKFRDSVYGDIKNKYFTEVTVVLSTLIKSLRVEGQNSKEMALDEIKKYVATQLQESTSKKKFIVNHLNASQTIVNMLGNRFEEQHNTEHFIMHNLHKSSNLAYVKRLLSTTNDKYLTLRLLCLLAVTQKLSENEFKFIFEKFLHEFGYNYGFVYNNLCKAGFLQEPVSLSSGNITSFVSKLLTNDFYVNARRLKQIPIESSKRNVKSPTCCSYVYGGIYIPLLIQICNLLLNNTPIHDIKTKLEPLGPLLIENERAYPLESRTLLVYVIGGLTYSEIAACNLLETLTGGTIVVCSDKIISGNDIAASILSLP